MLDTNDGGEEESAKENQNDLLDFMLKQDRCVDPTDELGYNAFARRRDTVIKPNRRAQPDTREAVNPHGLSGQARSRERISGTLTSARRRSIAIALTNTVTCMTAPKNTLPAA